MMRELFLLSEEKHVINIKTIGFFFSFSTANFQNVCLHLRKTHSSFSTEFFLPADTRAELHLVVNSGKRLVPAAHLYFSLRILRSFCSPLCFHAASLYRVSYQKSLGLDKVLPYSSVFNTKVPHTVKQ